MMEFLDRILSIKSTALHLFIAMKGQIFDPKSSAAVKTIKGTSATEIFAALTKYFGEVTSHFQKKEIWVSFTCYKFRINCFESCSVRGMSSNDPELALALVIRSIMSGLHKNHKPKLQFVIYKGHIQSMTLPLNSNGNINHQFG
jgi:hypothetical protein